MFENLIGRGTNAENIEAPPICIVYFTANWCGACKRLDLTKLVGSYPLIAWFKCDIDMNDYTAGYCGIRSIPTFLLIKNKEVVGKLSNSSTEAVLKWISEQV